MTHYPPPQDDLPADQGRLAAQRQPFEPVPPAPFTSASMSPLQGSFPGSGGAEAAPPVDAAFDGPAPSPQLGGRSGDQSATDIPQDAAPKARVPFAAASVGKADGAVLGIGALMLIFSFFGWWSVSYPGFSYSIGGWNGWWVLIQLLLLAVLAIKAIQIFTGALVREIPPIVPVAIGAVLVLLYLIALIQNMANSAPASEVGSAGAGVGIWACLILSLGFAYFLAVGAQKLVRLPFTVPAPKGF